MRPEDPYWAIGNLVTIYGPRSRVICLVQDMNMNGAVWRPEEDNDATANIELLGEIVDEPNGRPMFRRLKICSARSLSRERAIACEPLMQ